MAQCASSWLTVYICHVERWVRVGLFGQCVHTWWQTRDFSRRYCSTRAPSSTPSSLKKISKYFPKRLELSLRIVFAFPNAVRERTGMFGHFQPHILRMCMFLKAVAACVLSASACAGIKRDTVVPSSMGLDSRTCFSIGCSASSLLTATKYWRISLVLSVFPAPDSPLRKTHRGWDCP